MKKFLLFICFGVLSFNLLAGCSKTNPSTQVSKDPNTIITKKAKKSNTKDNNDIFLMHQKNYGMQKQWANSKDYFIFNDCNGNKIYFYRNNKLLYSMDNSKDNDKYYTIQFNSSGDNFICQNINRNKKTVAIRSI